MLPTPVRRSALDYFLGVGGSGRRPVEFADPTWGAGVWVLVRVALENPSTFPLLGPRGRGGARDIFSTAEVSKRAGDCAPPAEEVIS